jgi:uncharacterized protein
MDQSVIDAMVQWVPQWIDTCDTKEEVSFTWYGGEPLVNFDLMHYGVPKIYQTFTAMGIKNRQSVTTNGSLLDADRLHFLTLYNMGMLLSIDGPPWVHNKQRVYHGNRPTWDDIPTKLILDKLPNIEIAWQLDPRLKVTFEDVEWMMDRGFHRINFNINSIIEWDAQAQAWLTELCKNVGRACIQTEKKIRPQNESLSSNLWYKFKQGVGIWNDPKNLTKTRGEKPCGTSINMLALSPEGWLYPSQEMCFNAAEPGRAPGTMEYYKVGDVFNTPVIDQVALERTSDIFVSQMKEPEGRNCKNCVARPLSFGGCHCRYVGQDGVDPTQRHTVTPGWCQKQEAHWNGMMQAAMIEGLLSMKGDNNGNKIQNRRSNGPEVHGPVCQPVQ